MISWETVFLANTIYQWVFAISAGVMIYILLRSFSWLLRKRIEKYARQPQINISDLIKDLLEHTSLLFYIWLAVYTSLRFLNIIPSVMNVIKSVTIIFLLIQLGFWLIELIQYWLTRRQLGVDGKVDYKKGPLAAVSLISKVVVWTLITVLVLENIPGVHITTLIASLGIGGIAVGLALQKILSDLFASLTISIDQPFVEGDAINIGDFSGTVEHIGLKSTRIRSFTGEQVIFSNSDLLASRIRNYQSMEHRMVVFPIEVTYQTAYQNLQRIPQIVQEIVESQDKVTFNRAHFKSYTPSAISFEIAYTINSSDFTLYMNIQQKINLEIFRQFQDNGIYFAYPTRTIMLNKP